MAPARFAPLAIAAALAASTAATTATADRFEVNGVNLAYGVQGAGEPVLLIHGLYSSGRRAWELPGTVELLAASYEVITIDLPGHGQSDKPDRADAYGTAMVEDVVKLLDHLKIKKAHIVGYSMGGMITMKLMTSHADRVSSAVVGGMGWMEEGTLLADVFARLQGGARGQTPAACVQTLGKLAISAAELKDIKVPTTIIVGANDPVRQFFVEPLRTMRPDWPIVEIPDANHSQCLTRPEFRQAVKAALAHR
jgi:pimeloyl-ACP methyl ester carboxylesterase